MERARQEIDKAWDGGGAHVTLVGLERKATREFGGGNAWRCLRGSETIGYIINVFIWYRDIFFSLVVGSLSGHVSR